MSTNTILLQNVSQEELKELIRQSVREEIQAFSPPQRKENEYLTRKEVKELLKISLPTLNEHTKTGKLKGYRIGGRVLYLRNDIENSLKEIATSKYRG